MTRQAAEPIAKQAPGELSRGFTFFRTDNDKPARKGQFCRAKGRIWPLTAEFMAGKRTGAERRTWVRPPTEGARVCRVLTAMVSVPATA